VTDITEALQLDVDESYSLNWPSDGSPAFIETATIYGAMMGLQTMAQAVRYNFDPGYYAVSAAPLAIQDAPKF
jgi:hypothetical protein